VSEKTLKKRYLLKNAQEVIAFLAMASASIKKHITSISMDAHSSFGVIAFSFLTPKESLACEAAMVEYILADVTQDKRYKKRYLELFGFPHTYDFDVSTVFERLDMLEKKGGALALSFHGGMSTQKVLKVLLYQALIALQYATTDVLAHKESALKELQKRFENITELLALWMYVFDKETIERTHERLKVLLEIVREEECETIIELIGTQNYRWVLLDLSYILFEESAFYGSCDMPILFFIRHKVKKKHSKLVKKIKKSLYTISH
jgi:hypothetical protein